MNAIIAEESVSRGWHAGVFAGVGAMLADVLFFIIAFLGAAAIIDTLGSLEQILYLIGGALMIVFAIDAGRSALAATRYAEIDPHRTATGFKKAFLLGATNPFQLAFWLTVGVTLVKPGTIDIGEHTQLLGSLVIETGNIALLGGFFGAILIWITVYPALLVGLGKKVEAAAPIIAGISAIILGGFGLTFLWIGVTAIL